MEHSISIFIHSVRTSYTSSCFDTRQVELLLVLNHLSISLLEFFESVRRCMGLDLLEWANVSSELNKSSSRTTTANRVSAILHSLFFYSFSIISLLRVYWVQVSLNDSIIILVSYQLIMANALPMFIAFSYQPIRWLGHKTWISLNDNWIWHPVLLDLLILPSEW